MGKMPDILFASAEAVPFAKVGGLADVVGALPLALKQLGVQVTLFLPCYRRINRQAFGITKVATKAIEIPMGTKSFTAELHQGSLGNGMVNVYFVANDYFFGRDGIYDDVTTKSGYADNGERFIFFMKGILAYVKTLGLRADVIHCHDHQTALIPAFLKLNLKNDPFYARMGSLFTIHNLAYQGDFSKEILQVAGFDPSLFYPMSPFEFWGRVNFMKIGIVFSDLINTVSERYAEEIQTSSEFGMGLENVLRERRGDLYGILNGIDYSIWNPDVDEFIPYKYGPQDLSGKKLNKIALLKKMNLPITDPAPPLIGMISRLADQKGFDILAEKIDAILGLGVHLIVLGTGQQKYHEMLSRMVHRYPNQVAVSFGFDDSLAHLIEAGSDMFLMPSRYEPCGLNQMYSLKYGTVPVVRATGGLADTIKEFDPAARTGTGFRFYDYTGDELLSAVQRAVNVYTKNKNAWRTLVTNAMQQDYSWKKSAEKYVALYEKAIEKVNKRTHEMPS